MDNQSSEFRDFCKGLNSSKIATHLHQTIHINYLKVKKSINSIFRSHKSKRFSALVQAATKIVIKYSPEILMAGGLAYQSYEIHQFEKQMRY